MSEYLDWISVMTYDYHGQWDKITGHVAPLYVHPEDVDVTFNAVSLHNFFLFAFNKTVQTTITIRMGFAEFLYKLLD